MLRSFQSRCILFCGVLTALLSVLSGRLILIQTVDREASIQKRRDAYSRVEVLPAMRGMIVDRNEEPLAKSIPVADIIVDRTILFDHHQASFGLAHHLASGEKEWATADEKTKRRRIHWLRQQMLDHEDPEVIIRKHLAYVVSVLARPLGLRREELLDRIENGRGNWYPIARDLPDDMAEQLREATRANGIEGIILEKSTKRWYTSPDMAPHLIGFTGEVKTEDEEGKLVTKVVGRFGVEATMEEYLSGRDGWRRVYHRNAGGVLAKGDANSLFPPRAGLNVQLTLDMGLQAIVEEELEAGLQEFVASVGSVILMDPQTGDVLAMANRPHFNLNTRRNIVKNGRNFALQGIYEPGSTFKIVATSGVLNENLANPLTSVFCHNGVYHDGKLRVPDHSAYGMLTLEGVLAKSSNIGAYMFARQLGSQRFYQYVERYGFGSKTGIDLPGESSGIVRNSGNAVDFSRASYGYALNVTPLQMVTAFSAVANGGRLLRPRLVKALVANDGTLVEEFPTEVVREVLKPRASQQMLKALEKVVEKGGTATRAAVPGYRVAGKTGTAVKVSPRGGYLKGRYTVSFVGMLPAENPAFVGIVVVDDPMTTEIGRGGGTIAAPIFQRIATRAASRMNLKPTEPISEPIATTR